MQLRKATRKQKKLKLALIGTSGSGKTFSALRMAQGLNPKNLAVIDTEQGSSELYADDFEFSVLPLDAPYAPSRYIEAMNVCAKNNVDVLIVDSLSHAWAGPGGVLEIVDKAAKSSTRSTPFSGWDKGTPEQQKFVNAILTYPGHVIATIRAKVAYEIEKTSTGKYAPVKVGIAPVQREGLDYEFDVVFEFLSAEHFVKASKDRTGIFADMDPFLITEETGQTLLNWLNSGESQPDLFDVLLIDAKNNLQDLRKWYIDHAQDIERLGMRKQALIDELKQLKEAHDGKTGEVGA